MCGEVPSLWVTLFKTCFTEQPSLPRLKAAKTELPGCFGIRGVLEKVDSWAAVYRQRVVIRKPTMATPKPTRMFPAPSAGTG